eukprot:TRINITY_DN34506_c0_g2_i1.p1 TRINITY_DN34506_c0_g2~~TRINITY_DN34506_c0_g2_i1.p1  ORF type:complete len:335 (-),score=47.08 TRINITY_DN34506_c0_g2_i1:74-1036(-)
MQPSGRHYISASSVPGTERGRHRRVLPAPGENSRARAAQRLASVPQGGVRAAPRPDERPRGASPPAVNGAAGGIGRDAAKQAGVHVESDTQSCPRGASPRFAEVPPAPEKSDVRQRALALLSKSKTDSVRQKAEQLLHKVPRPMQALPGPQTFTPSAQAAIVPLQPEAQESKADSQEPPAHEATAANGECAENEAPASRNEAPASATLPTQPGPAESSAAESSTGSSMGCILGCARKSWQCGRTGCQMLMQCAQSCKRRRPDADRRSFASHKAVKVQRTQGGRPQRAVRPGSAKLVGSSKLLEELDALESLLGIGQEAGR